MIASPDRIVAQMVKELNQFRRDWLTVALAFCLPVAALLMYGFATRLEAKNIPVAIINYDSGKSSRDYIDRIFASQQLIPARVVGTDVLRPLLEGDAKATIVIPPEFSRLLQQGRPADVQALIDATDVNNARVIKNALLATTNFYEQTSGLPSEPQLIRPAIRLWFNPGRREELSIVPGAVAISLWIFPALLSALALVREKEQGTILQIYASNLTALELISGKALAYLLIGLVEASLVLGVSALVFGLRFANNPVPYMFSTVLYVLSGVLFGLFAGMRANTQMAAVQIAANVGFLGSMLLSGFMYPVRNIAYPLSIISNFIPAMYYMQIARNALVRGGSWLDLWYAPAFLAAFDILLIAALSRYPMKVSA